MERSVFGVDDMPIMGYHTHTIHIEEVLSIVGVFSIAQGGASPSSWCKIAVMIIYQHRS
jgi:hypothetical protein